MMSFSLEGVQQRVYDRKPQNSWFPAYFKPQPRQDTGTNNIIFPGGSMTEGV